VRRFRVPLIANQARVKTRWMLSRLSSKLMHEQRCKLLIRLNSVVSFRSNPAKIASRSQAYWNQYALTMVQCNKHALVNRVDVISQATRVASIRSGTSTRRKVWTLSMHPSWRRRHHLEEVPFREVKMLAATQAIKDSCSSRSAVENSRLSPGWFPWQVCM